MIRKKNGIQLPASLCHKVSKCVLYTLLLKKRAEVIQKKITKPLNF